MDKRIGAQLYTVRDFVKTEEDFIATMTRLAEFGYKSAQFSGVPDILTPERFREICDGLGIEIACTHRSFGEYENGLDELIKYHKALKCDIAGLGGLPGIYYNTGSVEEADKAINILNGATERLAAEGIEFAYHNHAFEFAKLENGQTLFDRILEKGNFKFVLDVYWLSFAGKNPVKIITELGDRVSVLHYKDMKVNVNNTVTYTDVGSGTLDWDAIVAVSDKARWAMVEEDLCGDDNPIDALGKSYKFLTSNYDFI